VQAALDAASGRKAMEMLVLDLRKSDAFTDFFVIATGTNARQVQAIADAIQEALKAAGMRPAYVEGYRTAEWILLDYFDFVVHVFSPAARTFYGLERLWGTAKQLPIEEDAPQS
jgi:ribosome-associated protein